MRENTRSPKKKLLAAGVAVALGAGVVGVGANLDYVTSILDNRFQATVADEDADQRENALLRVVGDPIDKEFDVEKNNDSVEAVWTIENIGGFDAEFAANFLAAPSVDEVLAENLEVRYSLDGQPSRSGGTLADPRELTEATGLSPVMAPGESVEVTVTVTLPDPGALKTDDNDLEDILNVVADWNVNYMTVEGGSAGEA